MNRARERRNAKLIQPIPAIPPPPLPPMPCQSVASEKEIPARYTEESPLIIDNTIISSFSVCSTKALIAYHHNLVSNEDSNPLRVGQAAHKALELFFKGQGAKEAMRVFQQLYYPYGNLLAPEEPLSWENTSVTMETWLAGNSPDSLAFTALPGTIEGAITAPLWPEKWGKRVMFLGLIDLLIQEKATGTLAIVDHKTTSRRLDASWTQQFRTSAQLSGYLWLAQTTKIHEKLDKVSPVSSAYINAIGFSKLPVSERKCATHSVPYTICKGLHAVSRLDGPFQRSPMQLESWLKDVRRLAHDWAWTREEYGDFPSLRAAPKQGLFAFDACKFCSYVPFCEGTISEASRLPQFYKRVAWEPWNNGDNGKEKNL